MSRFLPTYRTHGPLSHSRYRVGSGSGSSSSASAITHSKILSTSQGLSGYREAYKETLMTTNKPRSRKTSQRRKGAPRATQGTSSRLKELWATPEFRERMKQRDQARIDAAKHSPIKFSRYGIPDGMRRADAEPLWARARELADKFIAALKQNGEIPDDPTEVVAGDGAIIVPVAAHSMAEAALREAFVLAVGPSTPQVKSQAINTVLRFTKAKPESGAKLRLGEAEEYLKAITDSGD